MTKAQPAKEWHVFVHTRDVGYIGTVMESTEELARCAALSKFSCEGERAGVDRNTKAIFDDDDFDVRPA